MNNDELILVLRQLVIARNELINDLLMQLPESEYQKGLSMRREAWERDREIWAKANQEEVK